MRNLTHELLGVSTAVAASRVLKATPVETLALAAGALYGSRLPDVDQLGARVHRRSRAERRSLLVGAAGLLVRLPALLFALAARHRGVAHSVAACSLVVALAVGIGALTDVSLLVLVAGGLAIGYTLHVLADACTPAGVRLWAPVSRRPVRILPPVARIPTGSRREALLVALVVAGTLVALFA